MMEVDKVKMQIYGVCPNLQKIPKNKTSPRTTDEKEAFKLKQLIRNKFPIHAIFTY